MRTAILVLLVAAMLVAGIVALGIVLERTEFRRGVPACADLANSSKMWSSRVMCTMDGSLWLCDHGRCERMPGVP